MVENITLTGVLFLGGFVGLLLGLTLQISSNPNLKIAMATIGAALSGTPIVFMRGLGHEKWMYPIGLVVGLLWVRVLHARTIVSQRPKKSERVAWYIAWGDTLAVVSVTVVIVICTAFVNFGDHIQNIRVTKEQMPCRWAWIYLGRYNHSQMRYELPPPFAYLDKGSRSAIPASGDEIVLTDQRALIVENYADATLGRKCDRILEPPFGYAPETENRYKAGSLGAGTIVMVNQVYLMPKPSAEPAYVWALVGPQ